MIHRRFENIITYLRHRITNAASESILIWPASRRRKSAITISKEIW
jgi:hypothetical protein